jgi:integrase
VTHRRSPAQPVEAAVADPGVPCLSVGDAAERMLQDLELSPLTRRTYRHGLNALVRYLHEAHGHKRDGELGAPAPLDWLDEETLAGFNLWLRVTYPDPRAGELGASRTSRKYLVSARRLLNWLDLRGLLPAGVSYDRAIRRVDAGRGHRRQSYLQRPVDPEVRRVVTHYLRQELPADPLGRLTLLRNRALVVVLWDTAMRVSEALALTRADVLDGRADKIRLSKTKNGKPRTVFLLPQARRVVRDYCQARDDGPLAPLFVSHARRAGAAITPAYAWRIVKTAALAEGLYANTSPHSLRHARAQELLDNGMPLEWLSALLGHEHVDTTRIVYAYQTDEARLGALVAEHSRPIGGGATQDAEKEDGHDVA